jgi:hypothetical protein
LLHDLSLRTSGCAAFVCREISASRSRRPRASSTRAATRS